MLAFKNGIAVKTISDLPKHHASCKKWLAFQLETDSSHQYLILFPTDVNHHGGAQIQYCPTSNMVADFFTKPLLGPLFRKCCNEILNVDANAEITPALSEQECVVTQQMLCHPDCPDLGW